MAQRNGGFVDGQVMNVCIYLSAETLVEMINSKEDAHTM
jgi:hypothetical protein